ncbi:MAG TPA: NADP-dependent malic enzyme, partial [Aestuariivirgaceae bacterium]|nr:NADP-dependent malic enzyme [Aestuariivirgaceae bacterium]
ALAYSPGVAAACEAIVADPDEIDQLTVRGNLVGVISNGTAVLGLGNIGPKAAKPVMEGKAVLFKKFAGIDVFDLEVEELDVGRFCNVVAALEPTFGGINLEDIKSPECFDIEAELKQRMNIPVFHDDQHGTAIIVAAAVLNGLELARRKPAEVKVVTAGAGAAALACLNLLVALGVKRENIWVTDIDGVVHEGRAASMDRWKTVYAQKTEARTLSDVIGGAHVFLGLSAGGVLKAEMVEKMSDTPLILALANPEPEILPEAARAAKPDAMICTGRSDYPNQVNNVLCFPYIFRGALDVGATAINEAMKLAAVRAIAVLAHEAPSEITERALGGDSKLFGPENLIPSPFDPRLILRIAPAVARAAMDSGVARRPITDFEAYEDRLNRFVFHSGFVMSPVFSRARSAPKRVIFADGEDERVLRATDAVLQERLAIPILIGRPDVIATRIERHGLNLRPGRDFEIVNPSDDPRYRDYVETFLNRTCRKGVTPDVARVLIRANTTAIAATAMIRGDADAMLCGLEGRFNRHVKIIRDVIGLAPGALEISAVNIAILDRGFYFFADTYVCPDPSAQEIADLSRLVAALVRRFGVEPKLALLSHSSFGSAEAPSARKMRDALQILLRAAPALEVEGEMHGDAALDEQLRRRIFPGSRLKGEANAFIMPNIDAANIAFQLVKTLGEATPIGPMLVGVAKPCHVLTPSVTARGVINMTAIAGVEAEDLARAE